MKFGVLRFPGSCDERRRAGARASASGTPSSLWHRDGDLKGVDAVVVPGGFTYGDYLRVGAIARFSRLMEAVVEFANDGGPVLGICNGFQVLCEAGLLPGALLRNHEPAVRLPPGGPRGRGRRQRRSPAGHRAGRALSIPAKHDERPLLRAGALDELEANDQVVFRYAPGHNPNGSVDDIAGRVATRAGNVVGLMPHPEHAVDALTGSTDGLKLFASSAVAAAAPDRRRTCCKGAVGMYDYVIVGAGSAGCVLAARLSEDPDVSVLLVEAGPPDTKENIHVPAAFGSLFKTDVDWDYATAPRTAATAG